MPIMNMKYLFISICLLLPVSIHAQEFIRADNIFDLAYVANNGDTTRLDIPDMIQEEYDEYRRNNSRHISALMNDRNRHNVISDSIANRIMAGDTIQILSRYSSPIPYYIEVICSDNVFYEWRDGNSPAMEIFSSDELDNMMVPTSSAYYLQHIIDGDVVYTDSIPRGNELPFIYCMDKFIRILPGLYEHTRYQYAIDLSYIYYGHMDGNGHNAVRAHCLHELMYHSEIFSDKSKKVYNLRNQAIPDTIADLILESDTIYVMNYDYPNTGLHEVWRYDGNSFEYSYDNEDRLVSSETIDKSDILERIIAGDFTHKENLQYPKLAIINVRKFVRVSSSLFEFEKQGYYVDMELGEIYAPNR